MIIFRRLAVLRRGRLPARDGAGRPPARRRTPLLHDGPCGNGGSPRGVGGRTVTLARVEAVTAFIRPMLPSCTRSISGGAGVPRPRPHQAVGDEAFLLARQPAGGWCLRQRAGTRAAQARRGAPPVPSAGGGETRAAGSGTAAVRSWSFQPARTPRPRPPGDRRRTGGRRHGGPAARFRSDGRPREWRASAAACSGRPAAGRCEDRASATSSRCGAGLASAAGDSGENLRCPRSRCRGGSRRRAAGGSSRCGAGPRGAGFGETRVNAGDRS